MAAGSRFYLSRVIKFGNLTSEGVIQAIRESATIQFRGVRYTFTDFQLFGSGNDPRGVYARLAKYRPEGTVEVVRPDVHSVRQESVANLIEGASPFVYIPQFSGIAYKHVWNILERDQFARLFCQLIEANPENFFGRCELEPVTDLRTFVTRLSRLERITVLQARVKPPNPLFGPCWESLKEYLKKRRLEEVAIKEESAGGISTNVAEIAARMSSGSTSAMELHELMEPLLGAVGDAALLMAADGYGNGKVVGIEDARTVTIRTSENQKSLAFERDPDPEELFRAAFEQFGKVNDERYLGHK